MIVGPTTGTFDEGRTYCSWRGRQLLSVHSIEMQEIAENLCESHLNDNFRWWNVYAGCWIGLYRDNIQSVVWNWTDGSATDYGFNGREATGQYPWASGFRVDTQADKDCVEIWWSEDYHWSVGDEQDSCSRLHYPICGTLCLRCPSFFILQFKRSLVRLLIGELPTEDPTENPTLPPTISPSRSPSGTPIADPTSDPTEQPSGTLSDCLIVLFAVDGLINFINSFFSANPSVDPTNVPTDTPSDFPSQRPTLHLSYSTSVAPSNSPTVAPSYSPTVTPSESPTLHPIVYGDFNSAVSASFGITGWTNSEISTVNDDIQTFVVSVTTFIHQAFDEDDALQYKYIVLNISTINEHDIDFLINGNSSRSETKDILAESLNSTMSLQYIIECSDSSYYHYIGSGTSVMDRNAFESYVTKELQSYFMSIDYNSSLLFVVENMTMRDIGATKMSFSAVTESRTFVIMIVLLAW